MPIWCLLFLSLGTLFYQQEAARSWRLVQLILHLKVSVVAHTIPSKVSSCTCKSIFHHLLFHLFFIDRLPPCDLPSVLCKGLLSQIQLLLYLQVSMSCSKSQVTHTNYMFTLSTSSVSPKNVTPVSYISQTQTRMMPTWFRSFHGCWWTHSKVNLLNTCC